MSIKGYQPETTMRPYPCPNCTQLNHFEVRVCPWCHATLGYDPAIDGFRFLADGATVWRDGNGAPGQVVVCANNNEYQICNWLVESSAPLHMCRACRHNRTIPDLTQPCVPERWAKIEAAKRRLFHTLNKLGLPLETKAEEAPGRQGLAFDFLYDPAAEESGQPEIITGHDKGIITLNLIEADDAERERIRTRMGEPYRTLLGHLRHEVGHHFWSRLVEPDEAELERFRTVFGDERIDYKEALKVHYDASNQTVWTDAFVSAYAMSHPWEDFAESWAHYLHIVDVLATGNGFEMTLALPDGASRAELSVRIDPYTADAVTLASHMAPLALALNAMNRAMGLPDLYPFNLSHRIVEKLAYIGDLISRSRVPNSGGEPNVGGPGARVDEPA
ncbi:zinc-binding metallopeptidase family protein [Novosphingobium album (ex Liu et al. 2023)]|uniref:Zinc-binding metallopeptidase n=1 Tax=Novosphingobium album (ex Liu et al. 2023) TaxID=3031130 RepID=A0ABT5WU90_9SPHN|nr:putative zinc-binding metallopeptidase [Novosphingobium album (ex Liu et al. 2023)]MDE8653436.1 putative zinc-binding metallopeptidase [Novosphingobium album (ex Liu et al. 2023)]